MTLSRQNLRARLRAALALSIFLFGWLSVPVSLAQPKLDGCTMECCEEEGFCCCLAARKAHQPEQSDSEDLSQVSQLAKNCPSNCATPPSSVNYSSIVKTLVTVRPAIFTAVMTANYQSRIEQQEYLRRKESSPRAPPIFS